MRGNTHCVLLVLAALLVVLVSAQAAQGPSSDDYTCSPSKPCAIGCCGKNGVCGLGPNYCSATNCTSSCDQKSECDPGWGAQWSSAEKCPLNVCCSKYGFCGTTSEFCGSKSVIEPSCSGSSSNGRTIGYYEGWSGTRACDGMAPESIPAGAYTHLNYAFAFIDPKSFAVAPMADTDLGLYPRFTGLKDANPGLKTWISIGGWSMNDPDQPTATTFSDLAASTSAQNAFFKSLLSFMTTYGFDGVDIDWEYPVAPERSGKTTDYQNYPTFLSNLRTALNSGGHSYGLSITIPSSYWYMRNFDIVKLEPLVDWFNVMTYDLHGTWDSTDKYIGAVVNAHTNLTEINLTMDLLWRNNISPAKVTMGMGFYGRSFTLSNPSCSSPGCPFSSGGKPGPCSASAGTLMFSEIEAIIASGATPTLDSKAAVKQLVFDTDQWVSYDDVDTLKMKLDYANSKCLGGTMIWAVSTDSDNATAASALSTLNGLSIKKSLFGGSAPQKETLSQCVWGNCAVNPVCTVGVAAQSGNGKSASNAAIFSGCPSGQKRNYCCPADDRPTCKWVGTAPFCAKSRCPSDTVQIATDNNGGGDSCLFNHKSLCCTPSKADAAAGQCKWVGSGPFCASGSAHATCPSDYPAEDTYSLYGAGGESVCLSGYKSFCCSKPDPYTGCAWTTKAHSFFAPFTCATGCPVGKQIVAESYRDHSDNGPCWHNTGSYYCCDEYTQTPPTTSPPDFCAATDGDFVVNDEHDPDGNVADFIEVYFYEDECYDIPNNANPDVAKRWLSSGKDSILGSSNFVGTTPPGGRNDGLPKYCDIDGDCYAIHNWENNTEFLEILALARAHTDSSGLESRGRAPKVCYAKGKTSSFRAKYYPGAATLATRGIPFRSVANVASCIGSKVVSGPRLLYEKYVSEHVMELQTPAIWANSMVKGLLQSGADAPGKAEGYNWALMFADKTGYIFRTWQSLGVNPPSGLTGDTPIETIMTVLGSSTDTHNMLILDRSTNGLKAAVWGVFKNIISAKRFTGAAPNTQVQFINRLYAVTTYLNSADSQAALKYTYDIIKSVLAQIDLAAQTNTNIQTMRTTTFADSWHVFCDDYFETMQGNLQNFVKGKLPGMIKYWGGSVASSKFTAAGAKQVATVLNTKLTNVATGLAINAGWIS